MKAQLLLQVIVAGHDRPTHHVAVTTDVLGRAVHDEVRAKMQRLLEVWRGECVVDANHRTVAVRDLAHCVDVNDAQQRVGR